MNRVMRGESGVIASPKRLSVGFDATSSVQIHAVRSPVNLLHRPNVGTSESTKHPGTPTNNERTRMSFHENLLWRILSTPSDKPLFGQHSSDAAVSQRTADDSFDSCLSGCSTPVLLNSSPDAIRCNTPPAAGEAVTNRHLQLLYRDLNSPSATARLRALRALKSPSKRNAYGNFDVSHTEQDIITAEERIEPEKRNIQDILRDVCVYVEVRSGTDNRSDGIKEHIASLGAKVNERLLKDTTHVIFKDGLLSTYQKAKKMNIPVVSVLWIEACKRHTCLMNPESFKISNSDRYENPELFKKIRRQKSMQPGAEEAAGQKKRHAVVAKANQPAVLSPPSKLPVLHRIRKDDRLERILNDFEADNQITNANTGPIDEYDEMLHDAPMRMLERFRSTPTGQGTTAERNEEHDDDDMDSTPKGVINTLPSRNLCVLSDSGVKPKSRRKTILFTPQMKNVEEEVIATHHSESSHKTPKEAPLRIRRRTIVRGDNNTPTPSDGDPGRTMDDCTNTRRKTILAVVNNDSVSSSTDAPTSTIRTRRSTVVSMAAEKNEISLSGRTRSELQQSGLSVANESANLSRSSRRKTIVTSKENVSPSILRTPAAIGKQTCSSTSTRNRRKTIAFGNGENTPPTAAMGPAVAQKIVQRGTIYSPKEMEVSNVQQRTLLDVPASELTKVNSKGFEMTVSSSLQEKSAIENSLGAISDPSTYVTVEMGDGTRTKTDSLSHNTRSSVMSISSASGIAGRRRTLFTPGNSTLMEPLEVSETPPEQSHLVAHNDGSSIANRRQNPASSSTPKPTDVSGSTTNMRRKTLLEEYEETVLFSSTRAPERRRLTVFDISMDIMDKRLSEINKKATAAKGQSTESQATDTDTLSSQEATAMSVAQMPSLISPPSKGYQKSIDAFYRKAIKSCEKVNKHIEPTSSISHEPPVVPRKRKLFNVQPTEEIAVPKTVAAVSKAPQSSTAKPTSKRRSLAPTVATAEPSFAPTASAKKRRTTIFFESPCPPKPQQVGQTKKQFPAGRGLPMASQYQNSKTHQPQTQQMLQHLATTNLHTEQSAFVKEAIAKLNGFIIETDVTDNTTHLVTLEPRRTINLLRALIRGLWIIRYEWIVESFHARRWLPEEQFEVRDFSSAVQINRSERQAFGSQYRNELFADYAPFWISPRCTVPAVQLRELLVLCRGKVTGSLSKAKYLVVDNNDQAVQHQRPNVVSDVQIYVTPQWVLDSITVNKVKKLSRKYRLASISNT